MDFIKKAREIRAQLDSITDSMTDKQALDSAVLFREWSGENIGYETGQKVSYKDTLYRVLQSHKSQPEWTPENAVSLFAKVLIPDEKVIEKWTQPDSTNGYETGDKVNHNNRIWISTVDNNVWEPGVYGWQEFIENKESEE